MSSNESADNSKAEGAFEAAQAFAEMLRRVVDGELLEREEARAAMSALLEGLASPPQIAAFLIALRVRGESLDEITGFVEGMRAAAVPLSPSRRDLVDLCGTGGDGSGTFNISTAASLVVAGAGVGVAKHGNRSASSQCGSADVLEALGLPLDLSPERAAQSIDELGYAFLFAPAYHPAMRHVGPVRRELRLRTVFNILGPMANPAGVRRQLVGVFEDELRETLSEVLAQLGSEQVWAVHGDADDTEGVGLDELSIVGMTRVTSVDSKGSLDWEILPEDAGLPQHPLESLAGGDAQANARIIVDVLDGSPGAHRDAVVLNAAAALVVAGVEDDLSRGARRAEEAIDSGAVKALLENLRRFR